MPNIKKLSEKARDQFLRLTKGSDSIQSIRILDAVQLQAFVVPLFPQPICLELLFGAPRYVVDDSRDETTTAVVHQVDTMFRCHRMEKWQEKRVWICRLLRGNIFLVKNIMKEGGLLDFFGRGLDCGYKNTPNSITRRSGFPGTFRAMVNAVFRTRWT